MWDGGDVVPLSHFWLVGLLMDLERSLKESPRPAFSLSCKLSTPLILESRRYPLLRGAVDMRRRITRTKLNCPSLLGNETRSHHSGQASIRWRRPLDPVSVGGLVKILVPDTIESWILQICRTVCGIAPTILSHAVSSRFERSLRIAL